MELNTQLQHSREVEAWRHEVEKNGGQKELKNIEYNTNIEEILGRKIFKKLTWYVIKIKIKIKEENKF